MSWDVGGNTTPAGGWGESTPAGPSVSTTPGWGDGPPGSGGGLPGSGSSAVGAPVWILVVGIVLAVAGIAVGLLVDEAKLAVVGWVLAGPLAVGAFGFFLVRDVRRRAEPMYADSSTADWARRGLVVLATVGVTLNAWTIADTLARR